MKNTKKVKEIFENADLDTLVEIVYESTSHYLEKTGRGHSTYELRKIVRDAIEADRYERSEKRFIVLAVFSFIISITSVIYFFAEMFN
jgi:hypothetical protein